MTLTYVNGRLAAGTEGASTVEASHVDYAPDAVRLASGGYVTVWVVGTTAKAQIFDRSGNAIGAPFQVTKGTFTLGEPAVAALPGGGFIVTWEDMDGDLADQSGFAIKARMFDAAGAPAGGEFLINDTLFGHQQQPDVAVLADGRFVVAWTDQAGDSHGQSVQARLFDAAGNALGAQFLVNVSELGNQYYPQVTALSGGGFVVAWIGLNSEAFFQVYDAAGTRVNGESAPFGGDTVFAIAALPGGGFVIVSVSGPNLVARIFDAAGIPAGAPFQVNTDTTDTHYGPSIAVQPSGEFLVTWRDADLNANFNQTGDIKAQLFDAAGNKIGTEFLATPSAEGGQLYSQAVAFGSDDFAVLFTDYQDGFSPQLKQAILYSTVQGGEGDDVIPATGDPDYLFGNGGNDDLSGGASEDSLDGGGGSDRLDGGSGADVMTGGGGNDIYVVDHVGDVVVETADGGYDEVRTSLASFSIAGLPNIEDLIGDAGDQNLTGNDFGNYIDGGDGADTMAGGLGDDAYTVDDEGDTIVEAAGGGSDVALIESATFTLGAGTEVEQIVGRRDDGQVLTGNEIANTIVAGEGDDVIDGGGGADTLSGGGGDDFYIVDDINDVVIEAADAGIDEVRASIAAFSIAPFANVENLSAGAGVQLLVGNDGDNRIDGGAGADTMAGGMGDDTYVVDEAGDVVDEAAGAGVDTILTGLAAYSLAATANVEILTGTAATGQELTGNEGLNLITGGDGDDVIAGAGGGDSLAGGIGSDVIDGGAGDDNLYGEEGNDRLIVSGAGLDEANGGDGSDILDLRWSDATGAVTMNLPTDMGAFGYAGTVSASGRTVNYNSIETFIVATGSGNDSLTAGAGADIFQLGGGDDVLDPDFTDSNLDDTADGGDGIDGLDAMLAHATGAIGWNLQTGVHTGIAGSFINFEYFTRLGTGSGNDVIVTGIVFRDEAILLGGGDDVLTVLAGSDSADGGAGTDRLIIDYSASAGAVTASLLQANALDGGLDGLIHQFDGGEIGFSSFESFELRTGAGNDVVKFGTGSLATNDIFVLGAGDDQVDLGRGTDQADGGTGLDGVGGDWSAAVGAILIDLNTGLFVMPAGVVLTGFEYLGAGAAGGFVTGSGNDVIVTATAAHNDVVTTSAGNDRVTFFHGADQLDAGAGSDVLVLDWRTGTAGIGGSLSDSDNDNDYSGSFNDANGRSAAFAEVETFEIHAGSGNDFFATGNGNDIVDLGLGSNTYSAGGGNDTIRVEVNGISDINGGAGTDTLTIVYLNGDVRNSTAPGSFGYEAPAQFSAVKIAEVENILITTGAGADNITTQGGNDEIRTGAGNDVLNGAGGDDWLDGGIGDDAMTGGGGNDIYVVDSVGDTAIEAAGGGTDTLRTSLGDRSDPGAAIYVLPAEIEILIGTLGSAQALMDNASNNVITTTHGADFIYAMHGGDDTISSGGGNDFLYFGSAYTLADTVDGGNGIDRLALYGDYVLTFAANSLNGIERLMLYSTAGNDFDYDITMVDGNVAAGAQLEVVAQTLGATETFTFDGSAETNGTFWIRSGAGDDDLTGGAGADRISGGLGADRMTGGAGGDRFDVTAVNQSTGASFDTLVGFDASADRINIVGTVASFTVGGSGALSSAGFDAALAALVDDALGVGGAAKATATSGDFAGKIFVVIDANGDGVYSPGGDYVFAFESPVQENLEAFGFFS